MKLEMIWNDSKSKRQINVFLSVDKYFISCLINHFGSCCQQQMRVFFLWKLDLSKQQREMCVISADSRFHAVIQFVLKKNEEIEQKSLNLTNWTTFVAKWKLMFQRLSNRTFRSLINENGNQATHCVFQRFSKWHLNTNTIPNVYKIEWHTSHNVLRITDAINWTEREWIDPFSTLISQQIQTHKHNASISIFSLLFYLFVCLFVVFSLSKFHSSLNTEIK